MTVGDGEGEKNNVISVKQTKQGGMERMKEQMKKQTEEQAEAHGDRVFFLWLASKQQVLYPAGYIAVNHLSLPANCMTSLPCSVFVFFLGK